MAGTDRTRYGTRPVSEDLRETIRIGDMAMLKWITRVIAANIMHRLGRRVPEYSEREWLIGDT